MVWMYCGLLNHSPVEGHLGCFQFWLLDIKLLGTLVYRVLCILKPGISSLWGKVPKVK